MTTVSNGNGYHPMQPQFSVIQQIWDRQYGIWTAAPEPPKLLANSQGQLAFLAMRRASAATNNAEPFTHIELRNLQLAHFLRQCLPSEASLFNKPPTVSRFDSLVLVSCLFRS